MPTGTSRGPRRVLGQRYGEGPEALQAVLHDAGPPSGDGALRRDQAGPPLRRRRAAARAGRAARRGLAAQRRRLAERLSSADRKPWAWEPAPQKLKTPEEWVVSSARLLGVGERMFERGGDAAAIGALGQRLHAAPSPAGWSDRARGLARARCGLEAGRVGHAHRRARRPRHRCAPARRRQPRSAARRRVARRARARRRRRAGARAAVDGARVPAPLRRIDERAQGPGHALAPCPRGAAI